MWFSTTTENEFGLPHAKNCGILAAVNFYPISLSRRNRKMFRKSKLGLLAASIVFASQFAANSSASMLIYQNGFEANESPFGPNFPDVTVPGFTILPTAAPAVGQFFIGADVGVQRLIDPLLDPVATEGTQYAFIGNNGFFNNLGTDQVLGVAGVTSYTFSVDIGTRNRESFWFDVPDVAFSTITIGIEDLTGASVIQTTTVLRNTLPENGFVTLSATIPATSVNPGDVLRVFVDKGGTANPSGNVNLIVVDNLRITAEPIPEPASLAALLGAACVLVQRRRIK
jgi:hypothetical protein